VSSAQRKSTGAWHKRLNKNPSECLVASRLVRNMAVGAQFVAAASPPPMHFPLRCGQRLYSHQGP
jgi:hypothetical protein